MVLMKGVPDRHDADVCEPCGSSKSFLDPGLPSHPLMDDEGSQSNVTPRNSRERGATRDQEKARSDLETNTARALKEQNIQLQAQLDTLRVQLSDNSNEIVLEQAPRSAGDCICVFSCWALHTPCACKNSTELWPIFR